MPQSGLHSKMKAVTVPSRTAAEICLAEAFDASKASLPGGEAIAQWRESSFKAFAASGLPHRRIESWHYTDLRALMRESLPLAGPPSSEILCALRKELINAGTPQPRLVLVDGVFVPELSSALPAGLKACSLSSALREAHPAQAALLPADDLSAGDPIVSLNAAMMQDGVVIEAAPGAAIAGPVHLVHVTASPTPAAHFSRSALIIGPGASVCIAESCHVARFVEKASVSQANVCLIISLGENAALSHTAMISEAAPGSLRLESVMARLGSRAKLDSLALISGINLARRQLFVRLEGAESEALINGVSLLSGREHADTTLRVEHAAERCTSRETFKYILDKEATGVFQGKVRVAPAAQKTDSKMLSKAVLLSDGASMNSKPELEIFADDVICGHGSTSGGLDEDQLFYLQTRGLPFAEAEALLLEAFAADVIGDFGHEELTSAFRGKVNAWLTARHGTAARARDAQVQD
jgi:Fe-S cluster assembly protein SufD